MSLVEGKAGVVKLEKEEKLSAEPGANGQIAATRYCTKVCGGIFCNKYELDVVVVVPVGVTALLKNHCTWYWVAP